MGGNADVWLRCYRPSPAASQRLICFPHAGGSAPFYRPWTQFLPEEIELHVVQYPGRLDRIRDPSPSRMSDLADQVTAAVVEIADLPLALFGHSMGASVAYEVARRLCGAGRSPTHLLVSARPSPFAGRRTRHHLDPDGALWAEVRRLGGVDDEVFNHDGLRRMAISALRCDYRLAETYRPDPSGPTLVLECPISCFVGDRDDQASTADMRGWFEMTHSHARLQVFRGDHFYLRSRPGEVVSEVSRSLGLQLPSGEE